jgi:hypothetical protein
MGGGQDGQGDEVDWERKSRSTFRIKVCFHFRGIIALADLALDLRGTTSVLDSPSILDDAHASVRLLFQAQTGSTSYVPAQLDRVTESVSSHLDSLSYGLVWAKSNLRWI